MKRLSISLCELAQLIRILHCICRGRCSNLILPFYSSLKYEVLVTKPSDKNKKNRIHQHIGDSSYFANLLANLELLNQSSGIICLRMSFLLFYKHWFVHDI